MRMLVSYYAVMSKPGKGAVPAWCQGVSAASGLSCCDGDVAVSHKDVVVVVVSCLEF